MSVQQRFLIIAATSIVFGILIVLGVVLKPPHRSTNGVSYDSLLNPASLSVIVNKNNPLHPKKYVPTSLIIPNVPMRDNITDDERHISLPVVAQLEKMIGAAQQEGIALSLQSGYRSYEFQKKLYDQYVQSQGKASADTYSALAGYSEHQTGLAVDIGSANDMSCNVRSCFANTPESSWVANNAHLFGFIVRYPKGKQNVTGYIYEPWHLRYVGIGLAIKIHNQSGVTLEEYFDVHQEVRK
jgi:D-alanyl-D-alanine carboxypeptidase